jgi:LPXTG-site transpeptidase (sortase) family protein
LLLRWADDRRVRIMTWLMILALLLMVVGLVVPAGPLPDSKAEEPPAYVVSPGRDALIVPSIGLEAPIIPIELTPAGVLSPPADTDIVGWWKRSAQPGARKGQTVVTGHTVHAGGGVMNRLGDVGPGDVVKIRDEDHLVNYRVTKAFVYSKAELAAHADDLFAQDRRKGRLVLVTCTDWVRGDYLSNIIVFAMPVRPDA